jgi:hypothetical protein
MNKMFVLFNEYDASRGDMHAMNNTLNLSQQHILVGQISAFVNRLH